MPAASGTQHDPPPDPPTPAPAAAEPDRGTGPDPVLVAENEYLSRSRQFLRLMREDVLSLRALGGDPVSEEYLKADLYRRAEALHDLPDTPLFFGRLDYSAAPGQDGPGQDGPGQDGPGQDAPGQGEPGQRGPGSADIGSAYPGEQFHIGRRHVHDPDGHPVVIDWRAPGSRPVSGAPPAEPMGLAHRRRFGFSGGELTA